MVHLEKISNPEKRNHIHFLLSSEKNRLWRLVSTLNNSWIDNVDSDTYFFFHMIRHMTYQHLFGFAAINRDMDA
jgi:hypothetical protein